MAKKTSKPAVDVLVSGGGSIFIFTALTRRRIPQRRDPRGEEHRPRLHPLSHAERNSDSTRPRADYAKSTRENCGCRPRNF